MTAELVLRYVAFQLPSLVAVGVVAYLGWEHWAIDGRLAAGVVVAWALKDALLFPFVRVAYEPRDDRGPGGLRGAAGVVVDALSPAGRVRVGAELWKARLLDGDGPLPAGSPVRVEGVEGLTLVVAPASDEAG